MTIISTKTKKTDAALKTIGEVADIIKVAPHVIRFWENKFSVIKPLKNRGRRYFNQDDINKIFEIKKLLYSDNYSIKSAQNYFNNTDKMTNIIQTKKNIDIDREKLIKIKNRLIELRDKLLSLN